SRSSFAPLRIASGRTRPCDRIANRRLSTRSRPEPTGHLDNSRGLRDRGHYPRPLDPSASRDVHRELRHSPSPTHTNQPTDRRPSHLTVTDLLFDPDLVDDHLIVACRPLEPCRPIPHRLGERV